MVRWLMARLSTVTRKSDRARALVLSYEIDRVLKNTSAAKIQVRKLVTWSLGLTNVSE